MNLNTRFALKLIALMLALFIMFMAGFNTGYKNNKVCPFTTLPMGKVLPDPPSNPILDYDRI